MSTTIGASLTITGEIISQEDVTIHGRVNGQIRMQEGALLVAPKGHVDADVQGVRLTIHGTVAGQIAASERIELTSTADVTGTITASTIVLQDGATFNGLIEMTRDKGAKAVNKPKLVAVEPVAKAS